VPQHQDLKLLRPLRPTREDQQLEEPANNPLNEGQALKQQMYASADATRSNGAESLPQLQPRQRKRRSNFWDPQGDLIDDNPV
jgi:hypothetical protein